MQSPSEAGRSDRRNVLISQHPLNLNEVLAIDVGHFAAINSNLSRRDRDLATVSLLGMPGSGWGRANPSHDAELSSPFIRLDPNRPRRPPYSPSEPPEGRGPETHRSQLSRGRAPSLVLRIAPDRSCPLTKVFMLGLNSGLIEIFQCIRVRRCFGIRERDSGIDGDDLDGFGRFCRWEAGLHRRDAFVCFRRRSARSRYGT